MVVSARSFKVFIMLEAFLIVSYGSTIIIADHQKTDGVTLADDSSSKPKQDYHLKDPSVQHFARHGLCKNKERQKHFYKAMNTTTWCIKDDLFKADFVIYLCEQRDKMLDKWVAKLFDGNGNGYISHYERQFYDKNNSKSN